MSHLLEAVDLFKTFRPRRAWPWSKKSVALEPTSFTLEAGQTLAIMGETGSGKSTLSKIIAGVEAPTGGELYLNGQKLNYAQSKRRCQNIRMVFQDSDKSLNQQLTVGQQLEEPLLFNRDMPSSERKQLINS
ncbi:MAG: ATP-binding cassette domain-containing protein, partial [Pseudomonadota bacterium]|nr:ATP-binding cassette domain-containing protein [Pseudomonadota bacterium]